MPLSVGTVGGVVNTHPVAKINLKLLCVKSAAELGQVAGTVGLASNLGALYTLVSEGVSPQLLLGNNVLAHVPDLNDFVAGAAHLVKRSGIITFEFPHLERLLSENQFDTIYHEHFL